MELNELRGRIDEIDGQLIALLEQRMDVAAGIAAWKQKNNAAVLDTSREAQKLASVRAACRPETADLITDLFGRIMEASRAYQTEQMKGGEKQHG